MKVRNNYAAGFVIVRITRHHFMAHHNLGLLETLYIKCKALAINPPPREVDTDTDLSVTFKEFDKMISGEISSYDHLR